MIIRGIGRSLSTNGTPGAAIVATLTPGNYTAIVRGVGGTTGIGLVEVFRLPSVSPAR
ncbi:MAG: hypothetical protein ACR2HH_03425 [Chthoniobacterales bacterium]